MSEIMTSHVAITDEGDVVYPGGDLDVDPDELQARLDQEEADRAAEQRYDEHLQRAHSGNFTGRNKLLAKTAQLAGAANRSRGAGKMHDMGRADKIRGAAEAAERSIAERQKALELARIACRACPLKDFCVMGPVALVDALSKTGKPGNSTRQRFSRRVEKPGNKHYCDDNLRPGRLPKQ
ncbi:hypothetical protein V4210_03730 [Candidatus Nanosynbacter sp. BB002]|uniref:hypothetical protein n=1 Tax=Candidatus Nanosynbacter sp. BB002 TaxID=3393757 RepID=UPI0030CDB7E4